MRESQRIGGTQRLSCQTLVTEIYPDHYKRALSAYLFLHRFFGGRVQIIDGAVDIDFRGDAVYPAFNRICSGTISGRISNQQVYVIDIERLISGNMTDRLNKSVTRVPFVKTVPVPEDLDTVRHIGDEAGPAGLGISQQSIADIESSIEGLYKTQDHNMVGLCIRRSDEVMFDHTLGRAVGDY